MTENNMPHDDRDPSVTPYRYTGIFRRPAEEAETAVPSHEEETVSVGYAKTSEAETSASAAKPAVEAVTAKSPFTGKGLHERDMGRVTAQQRVAKVLVQVLLYAFLIAMAVIVLFPFYWMVISSLKGRVEYEQAVPTFWPKVVMWKNYVTAFEAANLGRLFINTVIVGCVSTVLSLVITVLSAFAFARLEFKGKNALFAALLAFSLFTLQSTYRLARK